jgi:hypothetical protein
VLCSCRLGDFNELSESQFLVPQMIPLVSRRQEMVRLYPDAEATMGDGKVVGETGPDVAGKNLSPTTVKVCFLRDFHPYFSSDAIHKSTRYSTIFL